MSIEPERVWYPMVIRRKTVSNIHSAFFVDFRPHVFWVWTVMRGDGDRAIATRVGSFLGVTTEATKGSGPTRNTI